MPTTEEFFSQALQLPAEARELLAIRLLGSLDEAHEQSRDDAWAAEIEARLAEYDAGGVEPIPSNEVFERVLRKLREGATQ